MIPASRFVDQLTPPVLAGSPGSHRRHWLDARLDFGAVGDGVTDDTEPLQALLNASTINRPRRLVIGDGTYRITSPLLAPFAPATQLACAGRGVTKIVQATSGQPILRFPTQDTHSWCMSDLSLAYLSPQSDPGSVAVEYRHPGGTANGWYHHVYARMQIENAYRGFALADNDGQQTIWNSGWSNVVFSNVTDRCFSFGPQTAIGMPQLRLDTIGVYNSVPATGPAIYAVGAEIMAFGLDIEGWTDEALWLTGGNPATIVGLHVEHHKFSAANSRLGYFANGQVRISDFGVVGASQATNTTALTLFRSDVNGLLVLQGGAIGVDTSASNPSTKELFAATNGGKVMVRDVSPGGFQVGAASEAFFGATPITRPTVTGSRGSNAALTSLITQLAELGLVTDSTT